MRYLVVGLVLGSQIASADPSDYQKPWERGDSSGLFLDMGAGWTRVHPPNGYTYRSEYLRIAPAISLNHYVYLGAAFQFGHIYSAYGSNDSSIGDIPEANFADEGDGSLFAGQVFVGARDMIGILGVAGELAPTVRGTSAGHNYANSADESTVTTIELHARGDIWATPHFSAGVMVGMDIASIRDFQAGLQIGFHLEPYDSMKR